KVDYLTPGDVELSGKIKAGVNELIIAVKNRDSGVSGVPISCAIDGYQGFTGGIYGDVTLHIASAPRIKELFAYAVGDKLRWRAQVEGMAENASLQWSIHDRANNKDVAQGEIPLTHDGLIEWETDSKSMERWS